LKSAAVIKLPATFEAEEQTYSEIIFKLHSLL